MIADIVETDTGQLFEVSYHSPGKLSVWLADGGQWRWWGGIYGYAGSLTRGDWPVGYPRANYSGDEFFWVSAPTRTIEQRLRDRLTVGGRWIVEVEVGDSMPPAEVPRIVDSYEEAVCLIVAVFEARQAREVAKALEAFEPAQV